MFCLEDVGFMVIDSAKVLSLELNIKKKLLLGVIMV